MHGSVLSLINAAQLQPAYGKKMADRGYTQPGLSPYFYSNVKDLAQYRDREKNRFPACG
jgi:hypothetical protein